MIFRTATTTDKITKGRKKNIEKRYDEYKKDHAGTQFNLEDFKNYVKTKKNVKQYGVYPDTDLINIAGIGRIGQILKSQEQYIKQLLENKTINPSTGGSSPPPDKKPIGEGRKKNIQRVLNTFIKKQKDLTFQNFKNYMKDNENNSLSDVFHDDDENNKFDVPMTIKALSDVQQTQLRKSIQQKLQQEKRKKSPPPQPQFKQKVTHILSKLSDDKSKQSLQQFLKNVKQDYITAFEDDTAAQETLQGLARFLYQKDKKLDLTPLVIQYSKAQTQTRTIKRQDLDDITFKSIQDKFNKLSKLGFVQKISLLSDIVRLAEHEYALLGELRVSSSQQNYTSVLNTIAKTTTEAKGVPPQLQIQKVFNVTRNNVKNLDDMFKIVFIDIFTQGAPFLKNILDAYGV